jgi:hypothetical protein
MNQRMQQMPLWRDASRLLLAIEEAVRHFPRYHKYAIGNDLRHQAMGVCRLVVRAYNDKLNRGRQVSRLVVAIDDLKIQIQLAKELRVFRHFREFQAIAELVVAVGKQSGGWRRRVQDQTA